MSKVVVTGADGFIGSHLVDLLHGNDIAVRALSLYYSFNNWGWVDGVGCKDEVEIISGDIRDASFCRNLLKDVDTVYHLAALIAIPYSYRAPYSYVETNVVGTLNICQAALETQVKRIVHISTSEVYGTARYVPIDESHPLQPQSPYSASKIAADAMAKSFFHSFGLPLTIARPFNTFGPRQSARAVIPTIITQLASGNREIRLGNTTPTRDFNYVKDVCKALYSLAESEAALGATVTIGSGKEISITDLFEIINDLMQTDAVVVTGEERVRPDTSEVERLLCDNSKLRQLTGLEHTTRLREGLKQTVDWFLEPGNLARYKPHLYNV